MSPPHRIAVLGGGITGLSAAFHLSRRFPQARIILINDKPRFGGWINSERVNISNESSFVLEAGPRTLRPNANSVLELINTLGLTSEVITVPRTSPAAQTRFLYLPEQGLTKIPGTIPGVLSSSLRSILIPAVVGEPFRSANRTQDDESVDSFLQRRFGEPFARNFGSALVHGIYAADSRTVSLRAAFPTLWAAETRGKGSIVKGILKDSIFPATSSDEDYELGTTKSLMKGASVFSFRNGLSTLTEALERQLLSNPNVSLLNSTTVLSIDLLDQSHFVIDLKGLKNDRLSGELGSGRGLGVSHIVSALPLPVLANVLPSNLSLPHLTDNKPSSVTVVNMVLPSTLRGSTTPLHPPGFGYLIPRPASDYHQNNPGILGVVFDSCALSAQDENTNLIKLTLMVGGPHHISANHIDVSTLLGHLAHQLGIPVSAMPEPLLTRIFEHKNCIPVPGVGHLQRMKSLDEALQKGPYDGRLAVIGAGVRGVSVPDCVESGKRVGSKW